SWHKVGCLEDGYAKICGGLISNNTSDTLTGFYAGMTNDVMPGDTINIALVTQGFYQTFRTGSKLTEPTFITNRTRPCTTASIVLASPGIAGLTVGDWIVITGTGGADRYRGTMQVASTRDAMHFTYIMAVDPGANTNQGTVTKIPWTAGSNDQVTDACYQ